MKRIKLILIAMLATFNLVYSQSEMFKYSGNPVMIAQDWETRLIYPGSVIKRNDTLHMWYSGGFFPPNRTFSIGKATSVDGVTWTRYEGNPIIEQGETSSWDAKGVVKPTVLLKDGVYHMWYTGFASDDSYQDIGHATSDDGITWEKDTANPVLTGGSSALFGPSVIFNGTEFHMMYSITGTNTRIGHATSPDGVNWTKDPANPVLISSGNGEWDNPTNSHVQLLFDGKKYHAWYGGGEFRLWDIGYATSDDCSQWIKDENNPLLTKGASGSWEDGYVSFPSVYQDTVNGKAFFRMWYNGTKSDNSGSGIGYAVAMNLLNLDFTKYKDNPVLKVGPSGNFDDYFDFSMHTIFDGETYHGWYSGYDGSTGVHIGYASSNDGLVWSRQKDPAVMHGTGATWDNDAIIQPCVIHDGSMYHMWYTGHAGDFNQSKIGYASSSDGTTWTKYESNPVFTGGDNGQWDETGVGAPYVIKIGDVFHMWYNGNKSGVNHIGHATSTDGLNWERDELNPVLTSVTGEWDHSSQYEPSVLIDKESVYHMFYSGGNGFDVSIGYAQSFDGRIWMKYDHNPILEPGTGNAWDKAYAGYCNVGYNVDSTELIMWYTGNNTLSNDHGEIGFASTDSTINGGIVFIDQIKSKNNLLLNQNYPNPFNSTTTIEYHLPVNANVDLIIYNSLGQKVATLVSAEQPNGTYQLEWDASVFPSGIYILYLSDGMHIIQKKIIKK